MQKENNFYQEMASEHRLQENGRGLVPLYAIIRKMELYSETFKTQIVEIILS